MYRRLLYCNSVQKQHMAYSVLYVHCHVTRMTVCHVLFLYTLVHVTRLFLSTVLYTVSINLTWHSSESKRWHSKFIPYSICIEFCWVDQKRYSIESGIVSRWYSNEI